MTVLCSAAPWVAALSVVELAAYHSVVRPDHGADRKLRAQVQLMFPK